MAPRKLITWGRNRLNISVIIREKPINTNRTEEKILFASVFLFSPSNIPTTVEEPTPKIIAKAKSPFTKGIAIFIAENSSSPT